jgi:Uri superfamily endonuclease
MNFAELPSIAGTYLLWLSSPKEVQVTVGKKGCLTLEENGQYIYVGSARGPGGLRARVNYHLKPKRVPHWHLDWLHPYVHFTGLIYTTINLITECTWSQVIEKLPGASLPLPGFGASDCNSGCDAHFYQLKDLTIDRLLDELSASSHPVNGVLCHISLSDPAPTLSPLRRSFKGH